MSWLSSARAIARGVFRRSEMHHEVEEELRAHIQNRSDDLQRSGLTKADADRRARIEFGRYPKVEEECHEAAGGALLRAILQDLHFALRQLRKSPGYAAVVIGSLALGIGASVAVFSVVHAVLLDPFPYKDADRMVHVELKQKNSDPDRYDYLSVLSHRFPRGAAVAVTVDDVFLAENRMEALTGDALPVSVNAGYYSSNLFTYMGVPPAFSGREFTPADVTGGIASPVAVLGNLFWKKQYGGKPRHPWQTD